MKEITRAFYSERIDAVKRYINDNYATASTTAIAAEFNFSKYHLCHTFKAITGCPIAKYINTIRVQKAFDEIVYTKKTLVEIALNCGFNNYETLTRAFSNQYKIAPYDVRNILYRLQQEGKAPAIGFRVICLHNKEQVNDLKKDGNLRLFTAERNADAANKRNKYLINNYTIC